MQLTRRIFFSCSCAACLMHCNACSRPAWWLGKKGHSSFLLRAAKQRTCSKDATVNVPSCLIQVMPTCVLWGVFFRVSFSLIFPPQEPLNCMWIFLCMFTVNLRNVCEILELSSMCGASQLRATCLQFVVINLSALLELRLVLWRPRSVLVQYLFVLNYQISLGYCCQTIFTWDRCWISSTRNVGLLVRSPKPAIASLSAVKFDSELVADVILAHHCLQNLWPCNEAVFVYILHSASGWAVSWLSEVSCVMLISCVDWRFMSLDAFMNFSLAVGIRSFNFWH